MITNTAPIKIIRKKDKLSKTVPLYTWELWKHWEEILTDKDYSQSTKLLDLSCIQN